MVNLILTCIIINSTGVGTFTITDTKLYVLVVILLTKDNFKLFQQLKSRFKGTVKWNKYLSKPELLAQNLSLNQLVESSFQVVNRIFVLAFENDTQITSHSGYYLPNVEIKDYNVIINCHDSFISQIKHNKITYKNIRKIATGQGDDFPTGCLLDCPYFKNTYKIIAIDLRKQQALDADPRTNQQINFIANLDTAGKTRIYSILEETEEAILDFSQGSLI